MRTPFEIVCPKCNYPLADEVLENHFRCCQCHHYFQAPPIMVTEQVAATAEEELQDRKKNIRSNAGFFAFISLLLLIGAVIALFAALMNGAVQDRNYFPALITGISFVSLAVWFYLIAQIIHIRANTEK